jgi:hypothetical protein
MRKEIGMKTKSPSAYITEGLLQRHFYVVAFQTRIKTAVAATSAGGAEQQQQQQAALTK